MSRSSRPLERYSFPSGRQLWHDGDKFTPSLGCDNCHYREQCGGLRVKAQVFDCASFCRCIAPDRCDNVCPKNLPHLVARLQEVKTLTLANLESTRALTTLDLPSLVPMIYHSAARTEVPAVNVVALPLHELIKKDAGELRFRTREDIATRFGISMDGDIILSGTDIDRALERWWNLKDRRAIARQLAQLGVRLITAPNFSLFNDVPRLDNLYNMKRIAMCSAEIQSAGLHCAVHLNARTERDWENWAEFLQKHTEFAYVAFEFGTGAVATPRFPWHVQQLCKLTERICRPLHLIVRGGLQALARLGKAYDSVSVIDTASFIRAHRRRRARICEGTLKWDEALTLPGQPIDDLLDENISTMSEYVCSQIGPKARSSVKLKRSSTLTYNVDEEALESTCLTEMHRH